MTPAVCSLHCTTSLQTRTETQPAQNIVFSSVQYGPHAGCVAWRLRKRGEISRWCRCRCKCGGCDRACPAVLQSLSWVVRHVSNSKRCLLDLKPPLQAPGSSALCMRQCICTFGRRTPPNLRGRVGSGLVRSSVHALHDRASPRGLPLRRRRPLLGLSPSWSLPPPPTYTDVRLPNHTSQLVKTSNPELSNSIPDANSGRPCNGNGQNRGLSSSPTGPIKCEISPSVMFGQK